MSQKINRDTITEFLFDTLNDEKMSLVADAIVSDVNLKNIYEEERKKIITHFYVDNELFPHERIDFEYRLKQNKELLKEVKLQKEINISLEDFALEETLDKIYNKYISKSKNSIPVKYPINRNIKHWLVAASISILIILGGGIRYHFQTRDILENRLYASYYAPFDYTDSYILNSSSFNIAKQKYMDGEYMNALVLLKDVSSSLSIEVERDFFIGLSLMEIGKFNTASEYFEKVLLNQKGFEYIPQIRWYMGLCYLKIGNKEKAIETFCTIVKNNDYNYKKAKRIIKKLKV